MFLGMTFSVNDLPQDEKSGPIPAGYYTTKIEESEIKPTKNGDGRYIKLKLRVQGPTHANAVLYANINIVNANQEAERIGKSQLRSIMEAIGLQTITDTDQLIGGVVDVKVMIEKRTYQGIEKEENIVKYFKKSQSGSALSTPMSQPTPTPFAPPQSPAPQQPSPPANSNAPARPW